MKLLAANQNPDSAKDVSVPKKGKPARRGYLPEENELRVYFETLQAKRKVVHTTRLPSGQIVDWIEARAQAPHGQIAAPPPHEDIYFESKGRRKEEPTEFQLDRAGISLGPAGTVPVLRKDLRKLPKGM